MFFGAKQAYENNCLIKVKCSTFKCHLLCLRSVDIANNYSSTNNFNHMNGVGVNMLAAMCILDLLTISKLNSST